MAGKYTRFSQFSGEVPKYLLPISNRTILHYVIKPFHESGQFTKIFLIANNRDNRFRYQIYDTIAEFGINPEQVLFIEDTPGQTSTAMVGIQCLKDEKKLPIIIHNIDTILYGRNFEKMRLEFEEKETDCIIDVFNSCNREYSYVLMKDDSVISILEKRVISDIASSGCYGFSNFQLASKYIARSLLEEKGYISSAIDKMIQDGKKVSISEIKTEAETIVLGTPEEYLASMTFLSEQT
jgi:dTDP-glucose pyrophosphorylase